MTKDQIKKKLNLDNIGSFHEGRAIVNKNGKEGHVDKNGKVTTPMIYNYVSPFQEGRAWVSINNFEFYINRQGWPVEHEYFYKLIKSIF